MTYCFIGIHKFSKWKTFEEGIVKRERFPYDIDKEKWNAVATYRKQERHCLLCGKEQLAREQT